MKAIIVHLLSGATVAGSPLTNPLGPEATEEQIIATWAATARDMEWKFRVQGFVSFDTPAGLAVIPAERIDWIEVAAT